MTSDSRLEVLELIDDICEQFELLLNRNEDVDIADWIKLVDESNQAELFLELLRLETYYRSSDVSNNRIGEYFRKFPLFSNEIVKVFASNRESEAAESTQVEIPGSRDAAIAGDLIDRFRIIAPLGAGGFSAVYLAHDPERNQSVALKVLYPQQGPDGSGIFEFIVNEANVLSRVDHPSIPKVFDIGQDKDSRPWVAMEFIKGESLYNMLATDQLNLVEVLNVLVKTAIALHQIHEAGFSHRDIKPDNIIIGLDGEPRILDYGLALHEDLQRDKSGERAGTTAFMSPEQVQGHSEDLDGRTDIWSLGVMLYLVTAKRLPFYGETKEDVRRDIRLRPVKPPRQIKNSVATIELENICFRALKKDPEDRYPTANDFAHDLQAAIDVLPTEFLLQEASRTRSLTKAERCTVDLARQSRLWNSQPDAENLPGIFRYIRLRTRTSRNLWSESEQAMMAAAGRRFQKMAMVIALLFVGFFFARDQIHRSKKNAKIRELMETVCLTPLSEVKSKFEELSTFAPNDCLDAINVALVETQSDNESTADHLRYAAIASPTDPAFRERFRKSLLDARADEIETIRALAFGDSGDGSIPVLDAKWRSQLNDIVSTSAYVSGMENIWPEAPYETVLQFEAIGGQMSDRYAMCTKMELNDFKKTAESLRQSCYQPVCVRPWVDPMGKTRVAAIWHRSTAHWSISWNHTPLDFMERKWQEPMHLVDVSDGLQSAGEPPLLVAVWSDRKSPYGKSRHMLLAEKIPQLKDQQWELEECLSSNVISRGIETEHLLDAPLLVDVTLHSGTRFSPDSRQEQQKLAVGEMISLASQPDPELIHDSPEYHRLEVSSRMKAEAYYALGKFGDSSNQFRRKTHDEGWTEAWMRTLAFARSGDFASASHSKALLREKLTESIKFKTRPFVSVGVARAIDRSVQAEIEFWADGDAQKFIRWVANRITRVETSRDPTKYTAWAEYYSLVAATNSVASAVANSQNKGAKRNLRKLEQLTVKLAKECIELKPSLKNRFTQRNGVPVVNSSRFLSGYLHQKKIPNRLSAWSSLVSGFESRFVEPRTPRTHITLTEKLDRENYFPISIVFGNQVGGNPKIGSIWHRELKTAELAHREQRIANSFCFALYHNEDIGIWKMLRSPETSSLKNRIIDSIFKFRVDLAILIRRLSDSDNSHERLSILTAIQSYTNGHIQSRHNGNLIEALTRIELNGTHREQELARAIKNGISPVRTANTTL